MSHYSYMTIPRMEADAVQESTSAAIRRARKIADNLSLRMKTFESDLEIEQNMIRSVQRITRCIHQRGITVR